MARSSLVVAPSLLACDFSQVGEEVERAVAAGADWLHLDLMDGHFVPNLSFGFPIIASVSKRFPGLLLDTHLMVDNPQDYVERLAEFPVHQITVHWEACTHLHRVLGSIKERGIKAGVAFNPHSPIDGLQHVADLADCVLVMTVNPGFGGQSFIPSTLEKLKEARKMIDESGYNIRLEVDGGVSPANIKEIAEAGADMFVAGSAILKDPRTEEAYKSTIDNMREQLSSAKSPAKSLVDH